MPSYFEQEFVTEIIFVNDSGTDDSTSVIEDISRKYHHISCLVIHNESRKGASECRNIGAKRAKNDFILFVDDDEYLEVGYARICLAKLKATQAGAVSGRRVYMMDEESPTEALARFGNGLYYTKNFRPLLIEIVNGAIFEGDVELPCTNAVILTERRLLLSYPFDSFYSRGNGYREETDYQMNLFVNGHKIIMTNDVHSIHLPFSVARSGGQRVSRFDRIYWSVYYTKYFYDKYYARYAMKVALRVPYTVAMSYFVFFTFYREFLRVHLHSIALKYSKWRRGRKFKAIRLS